MVKAIGLLKSQNWWLNFTVLFFFFAPLSRAYLSLYAVFYPIFWVILKPTKVIEKFTPEVNKLLVAMMVFALWQLMSILWTSSENITLGLQNFLYYTYWILIPLVLYTVSTSKADLLASAFLSGMFVSEILSYGVFFELWQVGRAIPSNPSPFMIHIEYGVFLAMMGIILIERIASKENTIQVKVFYIFFLLSSTGNLFLTQGRTGHIAFLTGIVVLFIIKYKLSIRNLILVMLLPIAFFITAYQFSHSFKIRMDRTLISLNSLVKQGECFTSVGERACSFKIVASIIKDKPLQGVGLGDYKAEFREKIFKEFPNMHRGEETILNKSHLHNQFLMVATQSGLIGLGLMLLIIYYFIKLPISNKTISALKYTFAYMFFISCLTEPLWLKQFTMVLFTLFSILFILESMKSEQHSLKPL